MCDAPFQRRRAISKLSLPAAGGRGSRPGHYFATADTSQREMRARTLQALQSEGYSGCGEITVLSDGAEIMKRLPRALPKPATHIIDWFHLAMKIQPMKQIAEHIVRSRPVLSGLLAVIDEEIEALKWKLWHGQVDRAIFALDPIVGDMDHLGQNGDLSAARLHSLGQQLLTYIRSNRTAIVNYGARYRSGQRVATSLAESAVNSLVAKRMVKDQQMRWSLRGAHLMLQVRAAMTNGNLGNGFESSQICRHWWFRRSFNPPHRCSELHDTPVNLPVSLDGSPGVHQARPSIGLIELAAELAAYGSLDPAVDPRGPATGVARHARTVRRNRRSAYLAGWLGRG